MLNKIVLILLAAALVTIASVAPNVVPPEDEAGRVAVNWNSRRK